MKSYVKEKLRTRGAVMVGLAVLVSLAAIGVQAFNPQPDPPGHEFGMVGVVRGQILRLNVVHVAPMLSGVRAKPSTDDAYFKEVDPAPAKLEFFDEMGNVVRSKAVMLRPGQSDFLELNPALLDRAGLRHQFRASVRFQAPDSPDRVAQFVRATLEIIDIESGRSSVILNPGIEAADW